MTVYPKLGLPSTSTQTNDAGTGSLIIPQRIERSSFAGNFFNIKATNLSNLIFEVNNNSSITNNAWGSGWTGLGVSISVIDDFNNKIIPYEINFKNISRSLNWKDRFSTDTKSNGEVNLSALVNYSWIINGTTSGGLKSSHGDLVSTITGGNSRGSVVNQPILLKHTSSQIVNCVIVYQNARNDLNCTDFRNFYSGPYGGAFDSTEIAPYEDAIGNYTKAPGIAKESLVIKNNLILSSAKDPIKTVSDLQGHLLNSQLTNVINLSMGVEIPTSGRSFLDIMKQVDMFPLPKLDAVIVVAAGNGGAPCATQDLSGCNALAVSMAYQESTKSSTIIAGALAGTGLSENIATYSTRAGILAQRFLLASGETDMSLISGTSFAAPKISGAAAIIKQKFPSLNSKQISDILLLSANKDINNDGIPDFVGVSPIYGHGKLDIKRALSLAGAI